MALDLVIFNETPVTILKVQGADKFLARLLASDVTKLAVDGVERSVAMNATGGVLGPTKSFLRGMKPTRCRPGFVR